MTPTWRIIDLHPPITVCTLCGSETPRKWGVPVYEGNLLSNDFEGDWFGADACQSCHDAHARGELVTWDHLYVAQARPIHEIVLLAETDRAIRILGFLKRLPRWFRALHGVYSEVLSK